MQIEVLPMLVESFDVEIFGVSTSLVDIVEVEIIDVLSSLFDSFDVDTNDDLDNLQKRNNVGEKEENCTHAINDPNRVTISIVDNEMTNGKFL